MILEWVILYRCFDVWKMENCECLIWWMKDEWNVSNDQQMIDDKMF